MERKTEVLGGILLIGLGVIFLLGFRWEYILILLGVAVIVEALIKDEEPKR